MQDKKYILTIDLGTTSIRTIAYDTTTREFCHLAQKKLKQYYPEPGWVEQDPAEILAIIDECLARTTSDMPESSIWGLGMTNQRETFVAWRKSTGEPLHPAIVWQDRRTADFCRKIAQNKRLNRKIHDKTGLFVDSYFSATKINWLIKNDEAVAAALAEDDLLVGTLDTFVVYHLTGGKSFITDHSNASRTLLYNIRTQDWDDFLLRFFEIPRSILPQIIDCDAHVGDAVIGGKTVKIGGILGDQQASLFGQCCLQPGEVKTTFGTGGFMLCNMGERPFFSDKLLTTVAWKTRAGINYAYEGNMYSAGACINWLIDGIGLIEDASESEALAQSVTNSKGVQFIPALSGLGAPFWRSDVKAQFTGLTLGCTRAHLVRAVLRSIAYQARAVFDCMNRDIKLCHPMRIDGGMTKNAMFMQFLSDILHAEVVRSAESESTSLGAAYMCGLAFGAFENLDEIHALYRADQVYSPTPQDYVRDAHYRDWLEIIDKL